MGRYEGLAEGAEPGFDGLAEFVEFGGRDAGWIGELYKNNEETCFV